ncbi:MAG: hypothetical protein AAFR11_15830 [Pseudomonadota bacterium]
MGVGRATSLAAMLIALVLAKPFLGGFESAFQTVQEYTGFIAPGVVAIFLLGFFDKRANAAGAFSVLISSVAASFFFWLIANPSAFGRFSDALIVDSGLAAWTMPFVVRIWVVFLICLAAGLAVSRLAPPPPADRPVRLADISFRTTPTFNVLAAVVVALLVLVYVAWW